MDFRSVAVKVIQKFKFICKTLSNVSILQIIVNLLITYICFSSMTPYSVTANIFVSVLIISGNLLFILHEKKHHMKPVFSLPDTPWWFKTAIVTINFLYYFFKNLFLVMFFTTLLMFYNKLQIGYDEEASNNILGLSLFLGAITIIQLFFYYIKFKKRSKIVNEFVNDLITKYKLDFKNTEFFIDKEKVIEFKSGGYVFRLGVGLLDGSRCYSPSIVFDYLNNMGISFNDLDEGHVKNIEMYGIGS
jgi:hypothetical protein